MMHKTIGELLQENNLTIQETIKLIEKYCDRCKFKGNSTNKILGFEVEGGHHCVRYGCAGVLPSIIKCKGKVFGKI